MTNPYEAPKSNVENNTISYTESRPSTPKVVGIIMMVFTILGLLGMVMSLGMLMFGSDEMVGAMLKQGFSELYLYLTMGLGVLGSIFLFYVSIQLIKYRDRGRKLYNYYMIYLMIITPLSFAYQWWVRPEGLDMLTFYSGLIGTVVGVLIYGLFWYLLNRPKVKAVLD